MRVIRGWPVAVCGGAGFLGSHLVEYLVEAMGCKVLVIDNLIAGRREFVHPFADFEHADITGSERRLHDLFRGYGCRFVFNYVAEPYIPVSFQRPLHVFNVNAMGALQVINAAQEAGVEGILQVSSAEIYGGALEIHYQFGSEGEFAIQQRKIRESDPVIPHSSYGAAKAAIDAMVQVRWREAKTPCIALRQFNCTGERNVAHPYVIPTIYRQLKAWKNEYINDSHQTYKSRIPTVKLGNNSFRDFLYAGDQARIATELLERGEWGEVYNLGSEEGIRIYDLAKLIGKLMGFDEVKIEEDPARKRPWEIWHLQSDNSKIRKALYFGVENGVDYPGLVPLEETLRRTIKWYEANDDKWGWEERKS